MTQLTVRNLNTYYGTSHVLQGVSLEVSAGETVCLLGRNGAGKSTTMKSVVGILKPKAGEVWFKDVNITKYPSHQIARMGIGYVPEDRRIFTDLTVEENLAIAAKPKADGTYDWNLESIYGIFPRLKDMRGRRGLYMSGGEQQMLAIARTLMGNPEFLVLDEPSEGLAPIIVEELEQLVRRIQNEGLSICLAEQNTNFALKLAQRAYVIDKGVIEWSGTVEQLNADSELKLQYLSV
jgi:branched-chain amino acid transport system ATP-binding protein